ncbi:MAG: N-acetyltransferase family protein [Candidatus Thorarchaeota archaeon]|jgi:ribosomal protein S18 acetylase RimI-like enzyme
MKKEIRKAATQDTDTIKKIARKTIDANYRSFLGDERVDSFIGSGASDQYMDENIEDGWVILGDGQIIGVSILKANLIDLIMIDHDYHRQGYGTTLLTHCEQHLFNAFDEIKLESFEGNEKAHNFYRKNGWSEVEVNFDEMSGVNKLTFIKRKADLIPEK